MENKKQSLIFFLLFLMSALFGAVESEISPEHKAEELCNALNGSENINNKVKAMNLNDWKWFFIKCAEGNVKAPSGVKLTPIMNKIGNQKIFGVQKGSENQDSFEAFVQAARSPAARAFALGYTDQMSYEDFVKIFRESKDVDLMAYIYISLHMNDGALDFAHKNDFMRKYWLYPSGRIDYSFVNKIIELLITKQGPEELLTKEQVQAFLKQKLCVYDPSRGKDREKTEINPLADNNFNQTARMDNQKLCFRSAGAYIKSNDYKEYETYKKLVIEKFGSLDGWPERKGVSEANAKKEEKGVSEADPSSFLSRGQGLDKSSDASDKEVIEENKESDSFGIFPGVLPADSSPLSTVDSSLQESLSAEPALAIAPVNQAPSSFSSSTSSSSSFSTSSLASNPTSSSSHSKIFFQRSPVPFVSPVALAPTTSPSSAPDSVDDPELPPPLLKRDNQESIVKIKEKNQKRYNELVTQGFDLLARRVNLPMWTPGKKISTQNQLIDEMNEIGAIYFEK